MKGENSLDSFRPRIEMIQYNARVNELMKKEGVINSRGRDAMRNESID